MVIKDTSLEKSDNKVENLLIKLNLNKYIPLFKSYRLYDFLSLSQHQLMSMGINDTRDLYLLSQTIKHFRLKSNRPLSMPSPIQYLNKSKSMSCLSDEPLPDYSCTVYKMGYVSIKKEFDQPHLKTKWRNWRNLYVELWGTVLKMYRTIPIKSDELDKGLDLKNYSRWSLKLPFYYYQYYYTPIFTLSLAGAEAIRALDYIRRPNVLRLTILNGPQFLFKLPTSIEMISWIEHLQAGINISLDLEDRPMPKFITIPTRGLNDPMLDPRAAELERAREQRRRDQHEILI